MILPVEITNYSGPYPEEFEKTLKLTILAIKQEANDEVAERKFWFYKSQLQFMWIYASPIGQFKN